MGHDRSSNGIEEQVKVKGQCSCSDLDPHSRSLLVYFTVTFLHCNLEFACKS